MKTSKYHIFCSWLLLVCFVAGQYMVYAHQHSTVKNSAANSGIFKNSPKTTVQEKCGLCDAMHHIAMDITAQVYTHPDIIAVQVFKSAVYRFKSIQLILAAGRAPPTASYNS